LDLFSVLLQVMHEMSVLVTEQGSILDRIDYNVSNALVDIKAGEKNVEEVCEIVLII
jgi:t-SNARE complex subunit (syntaxin)